MTSAAGFPSTKTKARWSSEQGIFPSTRQPNADKWPCPNN